MSTPLSPGSAVPLAGVTSTRTVKQGGALAVGGQGIKLVLQLGATAVLARLLLPADFGLLSLVTPLVAFFVVFRDVGLTAAMIAAEDVTDAEITSLFWVNALAGVLFAGLLVLLAPFAASFFGEPRLVGILSVMALTFVFNGLAAQYQALLQRRFLFRRFTAIDVGANLAGTAVGVGAAFLGLGYWSLILIPVATQFFSLIAVTLLSDWHPGAPRWEARTGAMARFGSEVTGFNFLNYFSRNLDNLFIGKVWGLEALGFYGRAYALMMAPLSQIIYPLQQVVIPVLSRMRADRERYVRTYLRIVQTVMLVCMPLVTWLLVSREWVVELLLGTKWAGVTPLFLALGIAALVQPVNNSTGWLLLSQGRSRDVLLTGVVGCCVTVLSIVAGIRWGALGVALGYSLGQVLVMTPFLWWFSCREGPVPARHLVRIAVPLWLISAAAGGSFEWLRTGPWRSVSEGWSTLAGLGFAFVWITAVSTVLLALHPRGRRLLARTIDMVRDLLRRRSWTAPASEGAVA
jgi:PST family polysaccharide transporter